jgi:hypothetical protein
MYLQPVQNWSMHWYISLEKIEMSDLIQSFWRKDVHLQCILLNFVFATDCHPGFETLFFNNNIIQIVLCTAFSIFNLTLTPQNKIKIDPVICYSHCSSHTHIVPIVPCSISIPHSSQTMLSANFKSNFSARKWWEYRISCDNCLLLTFLTSTNGLRCTSTSLHHSQ